MSARTTLFLLITALGLSAYVVWSERSRIIQVMSPSGTHATYTPIRPEDIQSIEFRRDRVFLRVERTTGNAWQLTYPVQQLAQASSVEDFLNALANLTPEGYISAAEIGDNADLQKSFGLDEPETLQIQVQGRSVNQVLKIGNRAPMGTRFFFQRLGEPGVFSANQRFLDALPETANEWRDHALIQLAEKNYDRMELHQRGNLIFEATRNAQSQWHLRQPLSARADTPRLQALVHYLETARVHEFLDVTDPPMDPAALGLNPPAAAWLLTKGTNVLAHLQIGSAHPKDPTLRHVYRPDRNMLALVPAEVLNLLNLPLNSYRDRRLLAGTKDVDQFALTQPDGFLVSKQDSKWQLLSPLSTAASPELVQTQLDTLAAIEIAEFVNDVITDLSRYGFDRPAREYTLYRQTNILAQFQFGSPIPPENVLIYARRLDEPAVYAVPRSLLTQLAASPLQLLDAAFTPDQVERILIEQGEQVRELVSTEAGWTVPDDPNDDPLEEAVEETLRRWGSLQSERFLIDNPDRLRTVYKIDEIQHAITLTFRSGANLRRLRLELGGRVGARLVAFAYFNEDSAPVQLFLPENVASLILTQLNAPPPRPTAEEQPPAD